VAGKGGPSRTTRDKLQKGEDGIFVETGNQECGECWFAEAVVKEEAEARWEDVVVGAGMLVVDEWK